MIIKHAELHYWLRCFSVLASCVWFAANLGPKHCHAEFFYSLGFGQGAYLGVAGQTVQIDLYIRELVTDGSVPRFSVGNNDGLFSIGATINYTADFGTPASIASTNSVAFAPSFDGLDVVATPSENKLEITSFLTPSTLPYLETSADPTNPNLYSILVGSVTFELSNSVGNTTTISIGKRELTGIGAIDNNLVIETAPGFFEQRNIDNIIQGSSTTLTNIAAVPEPGFLWLAAALFFLKRGQVSFRTANKET